MPILLDIETLHQRHRALTSEIAGSFRQAAEVCFSRYHESPVDIQLCDNGQSTSALLHWRIPDQRIRDAWANADVATENAAYGCVISGVERTRSLFAVRRAETGTGADYYIGPLGSGVDDLKGCFRLEVSGVGDGSAQDVARRLAQKVTQARNGSSSLPALAGVAGFSAKIIAIQDVLEDK